VATHERRHEGPRRVCLPEHHREQRKTRCREQLRAEERELYERLPGFEPYLAELKNRSGRGRGILLLRRLGRMLADYPREPLLQSLRLAAQYGLYDLERVERMVLRNIRDDFFPPLLGGDDDAHE
jgi:hypothetical protein